ncbi:MAG TPA: glycosyltransferase family 2 protein, partial [Acidimicrobiales bacterium]|nr:glycosyltransferase family 2 protein [Acidimicrobiales bacterium]
MDGAKIESSVDVPEVNGQVARSKSPGTSPLRPATRHKLTVAMPAHNEEETIEQAVSEVLGVAAPFDIELVVVDDGSTDATASVLESVVDPRLRLLTHERCQGKGAAVLTAAAHATGTHLLIFDADLEYSAGDIPNLMRPVVDGRADVVYGARVSGIGTAFQSSRYKL